MSAASAPRPPAARRALALLAALACLGFVLLGTWQVARRAWKHELIARVDARLQAAPVPAPGPAQWPQVDAAHDEYRRVLASGVWIHQRQTLVQAATELGAGYWVLTPLQAGDGTVILVNRGFVGPGWQQPAGGGPGGTVRVSGLLRLSEPGGGFLHRNDPVHDRWYSRDVASIAAARGLGTVAPYFLDADGPAAPDGPVGGLTVVRFNDNHLAYAITWYALAAMAGAAVVGVLRRPPPAAAAR